MDFSFQLYSARKVPSLEDFLTRLAALGYKQVEGFGGLYDDADGLAANLKKNGLTMPTGHFGLDQLKDVDNASRIAGTLGVKTLFCPAIGHDKWKQPEADWVALAETLAGLAEQYKARGFGFGWHNHHFEFWPTESGKLPIELILDTAPDLEWEMDVAWVVRGENDPKVWMDRYGDRITAVHVKDLAPEGENADEDGWADVGHGRLDWNNLVEDVKARTKAKYFVAEHDNPSDAERFARRSIETASAWK